MSSGVPLVPPAFLDPLRMRVQPHQRRRATTAFGVPGFFHAARAATVSAAATARPRRSASTTRRRCATRCAELVDFDLINEKNDARCACRSARSTCTPAIPNISTTATGSSVPSTSWPAARCRRDFRRWRSTASYYWDGGIVSNSPLWYVLDDSPHINALIVQVDLFSARGELPQQRSTRCWSAPRTSSIRARRASTPTA